MMNLFDARLTLTSLRMRNVLVVVHKEERHGGGSKYYYCKLYAITEKQGLFEITHHVAALEYHSLVKLHNEKKGAGEWCIATKNPHWMIRNIAASLYGDWKKINIVVLENEQVF